MDTFVKLPPPQLREVLANSKIFMNRYTCIGMMNALLEYFVIQYCIFLSFHAITDRLPIVTWIFLISI